MPVGQAERALPPTPADHRGLRAIPGGKTSPWCRPALKATKSGRFRFATTEVADPSPVLASAGIRKSAGINPGAANWFRTTMAQRKPAGCDLLHKGANRLALNLQDGPEDLPTLARHESGHPHRLGLDRDRRWSGACRAALSHSDLTERGSGSLPPSRLGVPTREQGSARLRNFALADSNGLEVARPLSPRPSSANAIIQWEFPIPIV